MFNANVGQHGDPLVRHWLRDRNRRRAERSACFIQDTGQIVRQMENLDQLKRKMLAAVRRRNRPCRPRPSLLVTRKS